MLRSFVIADFIVASLCVVWLAALVVLVLNETEGQVAAAWIQAVGSIAAIVVAILIARQQYESSIRREALSSAQKLTATYVMARDAADEVLVYHRLARQGASNHAQMIKDQAMLERLPESLKAWIPIRHKNIDVALGNIDLANITDGWFIRHLMTIRSRLSWTSDIALPQIATGYVDDDVFNRLGNAAKDMVIALSYLRHFVDCERDRCGLDQLAPLQIIAGKEPQDMDGITSEQWDKLRCL